MPTAVPVELPFELPPMPEGWKPGDPIPTLPAAAAAMGGAMPIQASDVDASAVANAAAAAKQAAVPPQPLLELDTGIDDDFVLNAEAVASDSDEESESDDAGVSMEASDVS